MNISVDCESSGPCPTYGDLIEFGAVAENGEEFYGGKFPPIYNLYDVGAYKVLKLTRDEHEAFTEDVKFAFKAFAHWLKSQGADVRHVMWSDNPAYDWQWINWGFANANLQNPLGHSARRIGDLYAGANGNIRNQKGWKRWRVTKHTHDPLDDARGAMEGLKAIRERFKL